MKVVTVGESNHLFLILVYKISSAEFDSLDFEMAIEDSKKHIIYQHRHHTISETLAWMWREMWVSAAAYQPFFKAGISDDIESLALQDEVLDLIGEGQFRDSKISFTELNHII